MELVGVWVVTHIGGVQGREVPGPGDDWRKKVLEYLRMLKK